MDFINDAAARHDARQEASDRRVQAARVTLGSNLEKLAMEGHTVFSGEDGDGFSIDVENSVYVDCDGFDGGDPTFLIVSADGAERLVQYDVSQMARFADRIEAYEDIAADPLGWCRDAADTAKGMADAA